MQLGADPDHLSGLARSLRDAAGRLDSLSSGLARRARATRWTGPDASAAERRWVDEHRPAFARTSAGLTELAKRADRHLHEQLQASAGEGAPPSPLQPAVASRTPPPGLPGPPLLEDRYRGTLEARVGPVTGAVVGEVAVHHLADGRRRVVLTQAAGVGGALTAGSGADIAVGGPTGAHAVGTGAAGDAGARAGIVRRRAWVVDEAEVDDLLAKLAVEQAAVATLRSPAPQVTAASLADEVVERLTGRDPGWDLAVSLGTAVPHPAVEEHLAEVEVAAGAAAGLGGVLGLGARAQGGVIARVGEVHDGARRSAVLELHGSATGALTSTLLRRAGVSLPADVHRSNAVRVEIPRGGPVDHLVVRTSVVTDTEVHDTVVRIEQDGTGDDVELAEVARMLAEGRATGAVAALAALPVDPDRVQLSTHHGTLSGHTARAGMSAGIGIGGGVTLRGQALRVDRR